MPSLTEPTRRASGSDEKRECASAIESYVKARDPEGAFVGKFEMPAALNAASGYDGIEEKKKVYSKVMKRASEQQNEILPGPQAASFRAT